LKDQYFGDINDYRKYGLIRALQAETGLRVLVTWMLTPNDSRRDGKLRTYLDQPDHWQPFDPELHKGLQALLQTNSAPRVALIEQSQLLNGVQYFSEIVPDHGDLRRTWAAKLVEVASQSELVFLDPNNGLEVPSRPYGKKFSSKYVFWHEVDQIWRGGASILIYQHYRREKRSTFIPRMVNELRRKTGACLVEAFRTPHVLFLLAGQPKHSRVLGLAIGRVAEHWPEEITPVGFAIGQI
jgi:hypothetical protein